MEYESENIKRRNEMLSRFRESLSRPISDRYFDEDELLEVFDYAGDLGDDYLRTEALLCAARYFPESQAFRERKAIYYNQYSDEVGNKYIEDNIHSEGLMWDIMRARRANPQDQKTQVEMLDDILNSYDEFADEEVIQFIDLICYFKQIEWLKEKMPVLREKVSFLTLLLYEVAIAAENMQDADLAVKMLEELTELDPFSFYYWMMLARQYEALDQGEKAINAIDYALAINPDDINSLLTKGKLLYINSKNVDDIIDILKKVLSIKPDFVEAARMLANVYSDMGNKIMASVVLTEFVNKYPESITDIMPDLVIYRPTNLPELLDRFYKANGENSQFIWVSWAHHLAQSGYPDIADQVFRAYERNSGEKVYSLFTVENLFKQKKFEDTLVTLSEYLENTENDLLDFPSVAMMHLLSVLRVGELEHAENFCNFLLTHAVMDRFTDISSKLEYMGMIDLVKKIRNRLRRTKEFSDWEHFDPLELWGD